MTLHEEQDFGLGRRMSVDERDKGYPVARLLQPYTEDIRQRFWDAAPSLDQGYTGTCVGHAWSHYIEDGPIENEPVDPYDIYREAVVVDEWRENDHEATLADDDLQFGTSVRAGAKSLLARGIIGSYWWATTLDEIVQTLLTQGPVVMGTWWYESMFQTDSNNHMWVNGVPVGGHAYVLNGIDLDKRHVRLKNSWGDRWGDNGSAFMYLWDLERLLSEDAEACLAVELSPGSEVDEKPDHSDPTPEPTSDDRDVEDLEGEFFIVKVDPVTGKEYRIE